MFRLIVILGLLFGGLYAEEDKTEILVDYKYNNLEYIKTVDDKIIDGEYNVTILYSAKTVKRDIKYQEKTILKKEKLLLKKGEEKKFKIEFDKPLEIEEFLNFEFIYKNLNSFITSQNFAKYNISFIKDNKQTRIKFINLNLDLDLDLDLTNAIYKPKEKMYLIKRLFGFSLDDIWRTTNLSDVDLIQKRFDIILDYNDTIEIWTKHNIKLRNLVLYTNDKINLPIVFLDKTICKNNNIYSLDINKFLKRYFPKQDKIKLKELQIFLDGKFDIGDIQKVRFLKSKIDRKKDINNYKIEKISNSIYRHAIDLKGYQGFKIKDIEIKIVNNQEDTLILKDINSNLFNEMTIEIPIAVDKYFPIEVKTRVYEELKRVNLNKKIYNNDNNFTIMNVLIKYYDENISDISNSDLKYFSNNQLSLRDIINKDNKYSGDLFKQNKKSLIVDINSSKIDLNIKSTKYFDIDSIILTPNFNISKRSFLNLIEQEKVKDIKESNKIWKILKLLIYLSIIFLLFKIRKKITNSIKSVLLKIRLFIESIMGSDFRSAVFYFIISLLLYGKFLISGGTNTNSIYISFAGVFIVIALSYLSLYLRPWILTRYSGIGRKIYRGKGSIYFAWAILFLVLTAVFVSVKLEIIAEQFAIIVYYLLVWGTVKEILNVES